MKSIINGTEYYITETQTQWNISSVTGKVSFSIKISKNDAANLEDLKKVLTENYYDKNSNQA